ncbi:hypothetical protein [Actinomadura fibrosa]|uniref:Secreted protein n=1 Tax=Actinomadura fibrosa TaxID=111802 RepID=A0ABW2XFY3_9ACTN|nr:hypothetical protein [Actinomadura fibrosa]
MKSALAVRTAMIVGVATMMTAGLAGTAFAGTNSPTANHYNSNDIVDATAKFYHDGDKIYIKDNYADGHAAVAEVWASGYGTSHVWATGGSGTSVTQSINYAEGLTVHIKACIGEYGSRDIISCSPEVTGVA